MYTTALRPRLPFRLSRLAPGSLQLSGLSTRHAARRSDTTCRSAYPDLQAPDRCPAQAVPKTWEDFQASAAKNARIVLRFRKPCAGTPRASKRASSRRGRAERSGLLQHLGALGALYTPHCRLQTTLARIMLNQAS